MTLLIFIIDLIITITMDLIVIINMIYKILVIHFLLPTQRALKQKPYELVHSFGVCAT